MRKKSQLYLVALSIFSLFIITVTLTLFSASQTHAASLVAECNIKSSDFNQAILVVLNQEGYITIDPNDSGGVTKYGLSYRYLKSLEHAITPCDIELMPIEEAIQIYRTHWWNKYQFGSIHNQQLATKLFSLSVNMGEHEAIELLEQACIQMKISCAFQDINKLNGSENNKLLTLFCSKAEDYYKELATRHATYSKYLKGWLNRVWEGMNGEVKELCQ